jgi:voltage-gated potassium channel Kch
MIVIIAGTDERGLGDALADLGVETVRVGGALTRESLLEANVAEADALVLTDMGDASAIPVAKDENPDLRVVTYSEDSLPEFARGQTDLAIDPDLLDVDVVAEELAA